jgi:hypothetical protein
MESHAQEVIDILMHFLYVISHFHEFIAFLFYNFVFFVC